MEKAPEQMTAWAPQGNGFHAGAEKWELSGRTMTADEAVDVALAEYDRLIAGQREKQPDDTGWLTGGRTKPADDIARRRERVVEHMRGYIAYQLENEHLFRPAELPDGSPAVEVEFTIDVNGIIVRGFIDLVLVWSETGALTMRDLKTGNKLPNDPLQLSLYGLAWKRLFGDVIEYGDFFMLKNMAPTAPFYLPDYSEEYIGAWLEMFHRSEQQGIYLPASGDHCRVCTVRKFCSLMGNREDAKAYEMPTFRILNYNKEAQPLD